MSNDVDVVIVGGGPVGLWLACELALAKVKVAVLERRSKRVAQSRALLIHGRTLEVLALRGLADRFVARGRPIPSCHFGLLETRLDLSVFDTRFPFSLLLPQAMTEELFEERLLELGVVMKRGHLVETVTQQEDGVVVTGRNDKAPFRFSAQYVVGADGARSLVRQAAAIPFSGYPARHTFMLGDVVLDAPPQRPMVSVVNEAGGLLVVPLGDGKHHRVVVMNAADPHVASSVPLPLSELAAAATRVAKKDFLARDPIWLSRFTDETRLAEHYRKDRILLAGDAAHIHAPTGGQGMNVGIQDAMNLGWKLASVVRGIQPVCFLDTYERERHPVGEALRRNTLTQLALLTNFDPSTFALRQTFEDFLRVPEVNRQLANELSGFGIAYPQPLFQPANGWEHRARVSGRRLPDLEIVLQDGSRTTLYRLLVNGCWVQLKLSSEIETFSQAHSMVIAHLAAGTKTGLPPHVVSALVRPDGYLAHLRPVNACEGSDAGEGDDARETDDADKEAA
jgi:2-polyprenyl-6-methoxyphenol hydroxylase-like FAD-dependent oxidoreductase